VPERRQTEHHAAKIRDACSAASRAIDAVAQESVPLDGFPLISDGTSFCPECERRARELEDPEAHGELGS
jgi:hypothetical protein